MSDLFISYSRRDLDFARRLHGALKALNRDVWIDLEDIPPTAAWLQEIYDGIEKANNFVFIISPDSVVSEVCRLELDYAVKHGKRLVPILYREVADRMLVHPALASHNWLFFRDQDGFDAAFQALNNALDTDLDHVKMHTRLLVRAIEWEERKQDNSFNLRGTDLLEAETWLASGQGKRPEPTVSHTQYILASRRAATARQRVVLTAITAGLVISLVLALLAFLLWRQAEDARFEASNSRSTAVAALISVNDTRATAQAQEDSFRATLNALNRPPIVATAAESLAMTAQVMTETSAAVLELTPVTQVEASAVATEIQVTLLPQTGGGMGVTGLLAAVEAYRSGAPEQKFEAKNALLTALQQSGAALGQELTGHNGAVLDVSYSPDGRLLASASDDNTIILWDASTLKRIGLPLFGHAASVTSVKFSPDSQTAASASRDGSVILWDLQNAAPRRVFQDRRYSAWMLSLDFSPDGRTIAAAGGDPVIRLWDVETGTVQRTIDSGTDAIFSVVFSPDGQWLASGAGDGTITLWDVASGAEIRRWQAHRAAALSLAFMPDGRALESGGGDGTAVLWDLETGAPLRTLVGGQKAVLSVSLSPDLSFLAAGTAENVVQLWDLQSGFEIGLPLSGYRDWVYSVEFNPDSRTLASGSSDGSVVVWDVDPQSWIERACALAGRNLTTEEWRSLFPGEAYRETCPGLPSAE